MKTKPIILILCAMTLSTVGFAVPKTDTIATTEGDLVIHFQGHASLWFEFKGLKIFVDPFSKEADYTTCPKADLILVTHSHYDHMDLGAIGAIKTNATHIIYTQKCDEMAHFKDHKTILKNGDSYTYKGIAIHAVPAYNIVSKRPDGTFYHPRGEGNGYVIHFGNKTVYIAGDTENIPEMKQLGPIDIAFIPMNLPYTMSPEQAADAARMIHPHILYPYHYGDTDVSQLVTLLKNDRDIEVWVREMR